MLDKEQLRNEFREYLKSGSYDMGKIKESDEVLQEMSIAGRGDWKPNENMVEC